ncbi:SAC3 domain-containing protein 1 isoform X2 [Nomia melanderi]|nr:SAC3 domain-containing protein 1 isoform X2 [Nomia melanderi]
MTEFIQGTCLSMCPEKERRMREKEGLLHKFEIDEERKNLHGQLKADPMKTVKCFGRPAAGIIMTDPSQLRPEAVLLSTIRYMFTKVATRTDVDWIVVYDFLFDRLRAVRQDVAIQRIRVPASISIFEPIVRFFVYSAQRLCDRNASEFDATINNRHLSECMSHLLVLYDEWDREIRGSELETSTDNLKLTNHREQVEALYILLNMGNTEALTRSLTLPLHLRRSPSVRLSTEISLAWYLKNYVRVCSLIQRLSPMLVCAAMINIPNIRRTTFKIMSSGYNSKVVTYPGILLQKLLLYRDIEKVRADCILYGAEFNQQNILFRKATFKEDAKLVRNCSVRNFLYRIENQESSRSFVVVFQGNSEMYYAQETLHDFLPEILLESA